MNNQQAANNKDDCTNPEDVSLFSRSSHFIICSFTREILAVLGQLWLFVTNNLQIHFGIS